MKTHPIGCSSYRRRLGDAVRVEAHLDRQRGLAVSPDEQRRGGSVDLHEGHDEAGRVEARLKGVSPAVRWHVRGLKAWAECVGRFVGQVSSRLLVFEGRRCPSPCPEAERPSWAWERL